MTRKQANNDKHFERAPANHVLRDIDRMRRTNAESGSLDWFPVQSYDVGQKASYFSGGGFLVEKRKDDAPKVKSLENAIGEARRDKTPPQQ